ncbi:hypothetical protein QQS21_008226 [Conoideocrella luteorostrata]|uniref:Uncharacterized protein n=1 Tax=Conoideocrella luteorostrata TaxID=1105319 RepID=A0AAJ0CK51_9HYPO|nr:hypothetical protein QQS21_008226 [Conoideocrella luteorostrata]
MKLHLAIAFLPAILAAPSAKRAEPAPLLTPRGANAIVPDRYIVKFKDGTTATSVDGLVSSLAQEANHVFSHIFKGFAGHMNAGELETLRNRPDVEYVEKVATYSINSYVQQSGATWGLGRISHRQKGSTTYDYDDSAGAGTCAYVIDTGVDDSHPEFEGRAQQVHSFVNGQTTDGHGHGTHCAGTIGSKTYGVAKKTSIYGVKVLGNDGKGDTSWIAAGMDFAVQDSKQRSCPKGVVANMSLGGTFSAALNSAAAAMIKAGIFLAVAAGNDNRDAAGYSPASEPTVCTVGASTSSDQKADFSNYGKLVDIFAPGKDILSTWPGGQTKTISGTSMAAPHITGLGAYFGGLEGFTDPQALCKRMQDAATKDAITGLNASSGVPPWLAIFFPWLSTSTSTVNLLAFNGNPQG